MQPITMAGMLLCFGVLFLRYRNQKASPRRSTRKQQFRIAKLLVSALLALAAIGFALRRLDNNLAGSNPDPSTMERVVNYLSGK
jgi:hypothetical protein